MTRGPSRIRIELFSRQACLLKTVLQWPGRCSAVRIAAPNPARQVGPTGVIFDAPKSFNLGVRAVRGGL